jgi:decaheme cytochrome c component MtrC/MtrF-like protein/doubled CXXCH motif protein
MTLAARACAALAALVVAGPVGLAGQAGGQAAPGFDHTKHSKVFPSCTTCHLGAVERGAAMWPDPVSCASCHDGTIQKQVAWRGPRASPATNLRFEHVAHAGAVAGRPAGRGGAAPPLLCTECHAAQGTTWMTVERPVAGRCVECHGLRTAHLAAPDTACATCHVPLVQATGLTVREIAAFPAPSSHKAPEYAEARGHGAAAEATGANCATCHAREFCTQCHVDAPERPAIQALAPDPRSTAIQATLRAPASHHEAGFDAGHGAMARAAGATCAACHTRESCLTCHTGTSRVAAALPAAGPGRGRGALITRHRPPSHGMNFVAAHAAVARVTSATCAGCHVRADCLECHRPDAARAPGYHPTSFLARHPAAAYARETNCSDCHNTAGFCASCHATAGLVAKARLRPGYHDANNFFIVGHGQAARLNLESCVSCHAERDCLTCHSALGGQRADPHGPGFDANRLIKKNPQMCTTCHGTNIPTR